MRNVTTRLSASAALMTVALVLAAGRPAAAGTRAFALTSDFAGPGGVSAVNLDTRAVSTDVATVNGDAVARWYQGLLYVVNRFGGDNIQVIDPAQGYLTAREFSVGNGTNPQDIAFVSPTKAYVTRYASSDLLIVNPATPSGGPMGTISLAAFNDQDGAPEMARMIRVERWLFVACQRLNNFQATNPSVVAVVDTQADTLVDVDPGTPGVQAITLAARNPVTTFAFDRASSRLLVGCTGALGVADGGIEAIDPFTFQSLGVVATGATLGGDFMDIEWLSPTKGYALVSPGSTTRLVSWNPSTGEPTDTLLTASGGFGFPDFELNDRGELYVCRNTFTTQEPPGLLVVNTTTDQVVAGPLDTGLPPIVVVFDAESDAVTGVPETAAALELSAPWPNPARGPVRLAFRLGRAAETRLEIFDAAGRRVRELVARSLSAGVHDAAWDLADGAGHRAGPGVYFARLRVGGRASTRRFAVVR
jgi:hypothetical protein